MQLKAKQSSREYIVCLVHVAFQ